MTDDSLRVGVIGCGYWGAKHARVLSGLPDVDVLVVESDPQRRNAALDSMPVTRAVADVSEVLDDVDAVVIATPPATHCAIATQVLSRGIHALVEKPLALSVAETTVMIQCAEENSAVLMSGHTFEYHGGIFALRDLVQNGEIGDVLAIDTARLGPGPYRADVDVLWDLAPHDVSIANFLLDSVPTEVRAMGRDLRHDKHLDMVYFEMQYPDRGVTTYGNVSLLSPDKVRRVTVTGSESVCVLNDLVQDQLRIYTTTTGPEQVPGGEMPIRFRFGDVYCPHLEYAEPLAEQARHFLDCIRLGLPPRSGGRSGANVVAAIQALARSVASGRQESVEVPPS